LLRRERFAQHASMKAMAASHAGGEGPRPHSQSGDPKIEVTRVYGALPEQTGTRCLVDRVWPRGIKKADLRSTAWLKDVAPSDALRHWFGYDPARWEEFRRRYAAELDTKPAAWRPILVAAETNAVTLLFGAKDEEHNQALALRDHLLRQLSYTA
jgi:uncharacterized protein YeaO (DUF488 family)